MTANDSEAGWFDGVVHRRRTRVYYEDTDFSGIVYHANYLKFAERGRSDYLRLAGVHHAALQAATPPLAFAVTRMDIAFHAAARIDDLLEVCTVFSQARGARFACTQKIWRGAQLLWAAEIVAACIDANSRPRRLPKDIAAKLSPLLADAAVLDTPPMA